VEDRSEEEEEEEEPDDDEMTGWRGSRNCTCLDDAEPLLDLVEAEVFECDDDW
jgi:hypothetical protein